jgi:hypothetical protein
LGLRKKEVDSEVVREEAPAVSGLGPRTATVPAAVFATGALAYVGILLLSVFQPVNWLVGWTVSIVGATMVTMGCSGLFDIWKHPRDLKSRPVKEVVQPRVAPESRPAEVWACPLCNQIVSESDDYCWNCGVCFEKNE